MLTRDEIVMSPHRFYKQGYNISVASGCQSTSQSLAAALDMRAMQMWMLKDEALLRADSAYPKK